MKSHSAMTLQRVLRPTILAGFGFVAFGAVSLLLFALLGILGDEQGSAAARLMAIGMGGGWILCQILLVNLLALETAAVKMDVET